jgi:hypothetical protein
MSDINLQRRKTLDLRIIVACDSQNWSKPGNPGKALITLEIKNIYRKADYRGSLNKTCCRVLENRKVSLSETCWPNEGISQ